MANDIVSSFWEVFKEVETGEEDDEEYDVIPYNIFGNPEGYSNEYIGVHEYSEMPIKGVIDSFQK